MMSSRIKYLETQFFRVALAFLSVALFAKPLLADRKWTAGGGSETDWTNDANWNGGTGNRVFYQDDWEGRATDNTIYVSFTNRTTESGNAFFVQGKSDTVVFAADNAEAGLDITVPSSGKDWWTKNFYIGTDNHDGALVIRGGCYGIGGGSLYIGHNGNGKAATGSLTVDGGTVNLYEDLLVGSGGTGTLTITNGGTVVCQSSSAGGKWVKLGDNGSSGANTINLEEGGTLKIWHIEQTSANSSSTVNFNGGTLTAIGKDSNYCRYLLGNTDSGHTVSPIVNILSKGGTIESVAGVDAVVTTPLVTGVRDGVDGGLKKAGAGGLTLAAVANTYTGPTVVKGGSLVLPDGGTLASTKLVLDGGTFAGKTFDDVEIASGNYTFSTLPVSATGTITLEGGTLCMTAAEAQATEGVAKVVVNGGTVLIDGTTAGSIEVGTTFTFGNISLGSGVGAGDVVKIGGAVFDWTYDSSDGHPTATARTAAAAGGNVWVGGAEGYWKDNVNWAYGVPSADETAIFNNDAHIIFDANKTVASIRVNATVTFSAVSGKDPELNVHDVDGTGILRLDHVGFRGNGGDKRIGSASDNTLTLEYVSASTDSWLVDISVYAPITGNGYIRLYGGAWLYGDNTSFTGRVRKDDGDVRFMAPEAGFPNAHTVDMYGTIWLWFREGEIAFGGNFTANNASRSACGINLPIGVSNVTLTLGGGNGYVNIGRQYIHPSGFTSFYGVYVGDGGSNWTAGTDKFTIRKVGSGTMNYLGVESVYNLSVEGGVAMVDPTIADPKWSNLNLTVKDGATFIVDAGISIASADFQRGSSLQSTYYETTEDETTTYGVNLLSVTGAATLCGVNLTAAGTTPNVDTVYTVLSAESVSGTAEPRIDDPDETDRKLWCAKVRSSEVGLVYCHPHPGLAVFVR